MSTLKPTEFSVSDFTARFSAALRAEDHKAADFDVSSIVADAIRALQKDLDGLGFERTLHTPFILQLLRVREQFFVPSGDRWTIDMDVAHRVLADWEENMADELDGYYISLLNSVPSEHAVAVVGGGN